LYGQTILGLSEGGTVAIVVAIVGAIGLVVPAAINGWVQTSKLNRKVDELGSAIATNHGKRPGEYLEMVAEALQATVHIRHTLDEHTIQDQERFDELTAQIQQAGQKRL
jgi:hypothetical protein